MYESVRIVILILFSLQALLSSLVVVETFADWGFVRAGGEPDDIPQDGTAASYVLCINHILHCSDYLHGLIMCHADVNREDREHG